MSVHETVGIVSITPQLLEERLMQAGATHTTGNTWTHAGSGVGFHVFTSAEVTLVSFNHSYLPKELMISLAQSPNCFKTMAYAIETHRYFVGDADQWREFIARDAAAL